MDTTTEAPQPPMPRSGEGRTEAAELERLRSENASLRDANEQLTERNGILEERVKELSHDGLTGLQIKSEWKKDLAQARTEARRTGIPILVGIMDLDGAKGINDAYGHERLDGIIATLGQDLQDEFRKTDSFTHERLFSLPEDEEKDSASVSRYGGDEFCFYAPLTSTARDVEAPLPTVERRTDESLTTEEKKAVVEQRFRRFIAEFVAKQDDDVKSKGFNIALGVVLVTPDMDLEDSEVINIADKEMRKDKLAHGAPVR